MSQRVRIGGDTPQDGAAALESLRQRYIDAMLAKLLSVPAKPLPKPETKDRT